MCVEGGLQTALLFGGPALWWSRISITRCMSPNTPPRVQGFDYRGPRLYFITTCTYRRLKRFTEEQGVREIAEQLSPHFEGRGLAVLAYCFMPDHVHLLLEGLSQPRTTRQPLSGTSSRTRYAPDSCPPSRTIRGSGHPASASSSFSRTQARGSHRGSGRGS